jgi:FKBP-type peptidyl-prolyl cis-trans isomerase
MKTLRTLLLLCLSYTAAGFVNVIGGVQLRNSKMTLVPALKMCNFNVSEVFERIKGTKTTRQDLIRTATLIAGLSTAAITVESVAAQPSADSDHSWTNHNGPFTEAEIADYIQSKSGLLYKDIVSSKNVKSSVAKDGDLVTLEMVGYIFETGEKWCNTYKGIPTYKSVIRAGVRENQKFMKGLNEGVLNMKKGDKRVLVIPAYLAYNYVAIYSQNDPSQIIVPGGAAIVCYVEVLDIKPATT